jgi:hypothetical protein
MGDPLDASHAIGAYALSNRLSLSPFNFQHTGPKDSGQSASTAATATEIQNPAVGFRSPIPP